MQHMDRVVWTTAKLNKIKDYVWNGIIAYCLLQVVHYVLYAEYLFNSMHYSMQNPAALFSHILAMLHVCIE